ncbi:hypothetical protein NGM37_09280, partial [Streptomyces sp. TRM76130]|nr:hypothetical protein [Streptomyces sp. TRM76130]
SASSAEAAGKPETSATAPTGTRAVRSGFAHDEQGAQSAAANYAVTLGSAGMFSADTRHEIVDALYTPEAAASLKGPMDAAYSAEFLARLG